MMYITGTPLESVTGEDVANAITRSATEYKTFRNFFDYLISNKALLIFKDTNMDGVFTTYSSDVRFDFKNNGIYAPCVFYEETEDGHKYNHIGECVAIAIPAESYVRDTLYVCIDKQVYKYEDISKLGFDTKPFDLPALYDTWIKYVTGQIVYNEYSKRTYRKGYKALRDKRLFRKELTCLFEEEFRSYNAVDFGLSNVTDTNYLYNKFLFDSRLYEIRNGKLPCSHLSFGILYEGLGITRRQLGYALEDYPAMYLKHIYLDTKLPLRSYEYIFTLSDRLRKDDVR